LRPVTIPSARRLGRDDQDRERPGDAAAGGGERIAPGQRWRVLAPLALIAAGLAGCAAPGSDLPRLPPVQTGQYVLGPGDRVRIITFGAEQLTGEFRVGDSGDIAFPLLGNVHAAGLTASGLAHQLTTMLVRTGMFKQPSVAVEVAEYRPIFILGEVKKPGQYPYQPGMTVLTAVAIAGGFTYRAIEDVFSVVRSADGHTMEGRARRQTLLQPGDVITVFERHF
jgi:polysaccharide biosynthesis/export protein